MVLCATSQISINDTQLAQMMKHCYVAADGDN